MQFSYLFSGVEWKLTIYLFITVLPPCSVSFPLWVGLLSKWKFWEAPLFCIRKFLVPHLLLNWGEFQLDLQKPRAWSYHHNLVQSHSLDGLSSVVIGSNHWIPHTNTLPGSGYEEWIVTVPSSGTFPVADPMSNPLLGQWNLTVWLPRPRN